MRRLFKQRKMTGSIIIILILIGIMAGMLSGLIGVGGGIIVVPALIYFLHFSQLEAQGTSLGLLLLPVGILAVANYYKGGYIDVKVVGIMCLAFVFGGWLGSKLSMAISEELVKKVFAFVLLLTAAKMLGLDEWLLEIYKKYF